MSPKVTFKQYLAESRAWAEQDRTARKTGGGTPKGDPASGWKAYKRMKEAQAPLGEEDLGEAKYETHGNHVGIHVDKILQKHGEGSFDRTEHHPDTATHYASTIHYTSKQGAQKKLVQTSKKFRRGVSEGLHEAYGDDHKPAGAVDKKTMKIAFIGTVAERNAFMAKHPDKYFKSILKDKDKVGDVWGHKGPGHDGLDEAGVGFDLNRKEPRETDTSTDEGREDPDADINDADVKTRRYEPPFKYDIPKKSKTDEHDYPKHWSQKKATVKEGFASHQIQQTHISKATHVAAKGELGTKRAHDDHPDNDDIEARIRAARKANRGLKEGMFSRAVGALKDKGQALSDKISGRKDRETDRAVRARDREQDADNDASVRIDKLDKKVERSMERRDKIKGAAKKLFNKLGK